MAIEILIIEYNVMTDKSDRYVLIDTDNLTGLITGGYQPLSQLLYC